MRFVADLKRRTARARRYSQSEGRRTASVRTRLVSAGRGVTERERGAKRRQPKGGTRRDGHGLHCHDCHSREQAVQGRANHAAARGRRPRGNCRAQEWRIVSWRARRGRGHDELPTQRRCVCLPPHVMSLSPLLSTPLLSSPLLSSHNRTPHPTPQSPQPNPSTQ